MGILTTLPLHRLPATLSTVTLFSAIRNVAVLGAVYLFSLIIYRLYFHPLAKYPGPFLSKFTDWVVAWQAWRGNRYLELYKAHEKYGPVVRVAPNMLSFNSASALKNIYGHSANARNIQKGQFYTAYPAVKGVHNTHNSISKMEHGFKRRVLSVAFSEAALKSMEGMMIDAVEALVAGISRDRKADMGERFSWLTFDIMGELCFGRSFGMLTSPAQRFVTDLISKATHNHYICGNYLPIRFMGLGRLLFPTIARDRWRFIEHSRACANERMGLDVAAKKDFFYYLLNAKDPETGRGFSTKELWGEANVLMIAGSDTTATALSSTLFHLTAHNPAAMKKLQDEIRGNFSRYEDIVTGKELADCHYLKACIDEAMRISPPVPGLLARETVNDCTIDGQKLPEGTGVGVPIYTIHHNPEYFPEPFTYKPERWLDSDTATLEKARSAFNPFSLGARGCIGKSVAYMELRLAIARLVWKFDMEHVPTEGVAERWREGFAVKEGEYRLMDHFTCKKVGPMIAFKPREVTA
jgi:cytochrome P450